MTSIKNPDAPAATRDRGLSAANVMLKDFINDPSHWRKRAEETRDLAKRVIDDAERKRLSDLAKEF